MLKFLRRHIYKLLLFFGMSIFVFYVSAISINKVNTMHSHYFDLGIMNQVAFNTSEGHFLQMTNHRSTTNTSRLAEHFDPILAVFAPLYWFNNNPNNLIVSQAILLAFGAVAIYLLSKHIIKSQKWALFLSYTYLFFYPLQNQSIFDFHAITLAGPFLLFAFYFVLKKNYLVSTLFVLLSFLTKENIGLVTFFLGLYFLFFSTHKKYGSFLIALSLFTLFLVNAIIMPALGSKAATLTYFYHFGHSPLSILVGIITQPKLLLQTMFAPDRIKYLADLYLPFLPLTIFSPLLLLVPVSDLMMNLLSINPNMRNTIFHYNSLLIPFILLSAISGFRIINKHRYSKYLKFTFVVTYLLFFYGKAIFPPFLTKNPYQFKSINQNLLNTIHIWQSKLNNANISISTTPHIAPFFTSRKFYVNFLYDPSFELQLRQKEEVYKRVGKYNGVDYVIINLEEVNNPSHNNLAKKFYKHLKNNTNYKKIYEDKSGIIVYRNIKISSNLVN